MVPRKKRVFWGQTPLLMNYSDEQSKQRYILMIIIKNNSKHMINFNHMFNNKLIMWLDLIIWLSKFNTVLVLTTSWTTDPRCLAVHRGTPNVQALETCAKTVKCKGKESKGSKEPVSLTWLNITIFC
jgi:hypothetical protein